MKLPVVDLNNKKIETTQAPVELFESVVNQQILAQYLRVFLHRQRQGTKRAQTRGEVSGTTAKVWRQKGTGRARHGSRKAPIFVGGGKAHGPTGQENYKLSMSKQMKAKALCAALTAQASNITLVDSFDKVDAKTKNLHTILERLVENVDKQLVTIVLDQPLDLLLKASRNLSNVLVTQASRINAYEVINADKLIMTKASIEILKNTFASKIKTPPTK